MQLPYINLPQSQAPQILGDIGDTLVSAARRKQEQEQQAIQNLMQKQRLEADQARMRAEENRAQAQEHRATIAATREQHQYEAQQAAAVQAAVEKAHAHFQAGDPGSAQAILEANHSKATLRPLAAQDPGAAPGAPQAPAEQGPIPAPEERALSFAGQPGNQAPVAEQAISEDQRMLGERQQYAQALADHPRLVAEHQAHQQAFQQAKQNPVYDIETPYGKSTFDLEAERQHQQAQAQLQGQQATQGFGDTAGKAVGSAGAMGVTDPVQLAKIAQDEQRREADRLATKDLAGEKGKNALEIAAIRAAERKRRAAAGLSGGGGPGSKQYQAEERELASELTKYETVHKLTGKDSIAEHQHELGAAVQMAEAPNQNGVTQLKIMDKMIRAATGLGVRNQTLATYQSHMGGLAAQGENKLEQWASGAAGKAAWANVVASVRGDLTEAQKRGAEENKAYWDMVGASPAMQRHQDLVQRRERGAFGGMAGYGGKGDAKAPDGPAAMPPGSKRVTYKGQPGYLTPDNVFHADGG